MFESKKPSIIQGDCLHVLRDMPDLSVDAIVTDPPYGLSNTTPSQVTETLLKWANGDREYIPEGKGFGGATWDSFVPPPAVWDECLRVLKPGGHLLAFAGSRTIDLMTLSIRLAGFDIRDTISYLYGTGFAKSTDVSKAIDKTGGKGLAWFGDWLRKERSERGMTAQKLAELGGFYKNVNHGGLVVNWEKGLSLPTAEQFNKVCDIFGVDFDRIEILERTVLGTRKVNAGLAFTSEGVTELEITASATEEARKWEGWATGLKPANEPIVMARKPFQNTVAANVLEYGTGALNIDATRVSTQDKLSGGHSSSGQQMTDGWRRPWMNDPDKVAANAERSKEAVAKAEKLGRWPANVILAHHEQCVLVGEKQIKTGTAVLRNGGGQTIFSGISNNTKTGGRDTDHGYGDADGKEKVEVWDCVPGCAVSELNSQSGIQKSRPQGKPSVGTKKPTDSTNFTGINSGIGYTDTGGAARFFYTAKAKKSERPSFEKDGKKIVHPTVKPLDLMQWLVRLVTPPGGIVLDPFAGSGSTLEAAWLEGFDSIGIERELDYIQLINIRLDKYKT